MGSSFPVRYAVTIQAFITSLTILISLVIGAIAYAIFSGQIDNAVFELEARRLQSLNRRAALRIDAFLRRHEAELGQHAAALTDFALDSPPALRRWNERILEADDSWAWLAHITAGGEVRVAIKGRLEGISVSDRDWFRDGLKRSRVHGDLTEWPALAQALPPYPDGKPWKFVSLSIAVRDKTGRQSGMLTGMISQETLEKEVADLYTAQPDLGGSLLWVIGRDGTTRLNALPATLPDWKPTAAMLASTEAGGAPFSDSAGKHWILTYAPLSAAAPGSMQDWVVVSAIDSDDVEVPGLLHARYLAAMAAITILLLGVLVWLLFSADCT